MKYRVFGEKIALRLEKGDKIMECIKDICTRVTAVKAGIISGLGACRTATLGVYNLPGKEYIPHDYEGNLELASLTGNVSQMNGEVYLHIHAVFGDEKGNVYAGHLNEAEISATGEIFITVLDGVIDRKYSDEIGLNLMQF